MKFEIAPKEYWVQCTYHDIKMHFFLLASTGKSDWRLPSCVEEDVLELRKYGDCWVEEDADLPFMHDELLVLIAIRDAKDN